MRARSGTVSKQRHKKILKKAKGYSSRRSNTYRQAKRAVMQAGQNAYVSRKVRKRDFRTLWIARLNAALQAYDVKYSRFIYALTRKQVGLNRKMLSELAISEPEVFAEIVRFVKG